MIGTSPGVENGKLPESESCNCRLLSTVDDKVTPSELACVDDEKYPPFKSSVAEEVDVGKLAGLSALTAGRVGCTLSLTGWMISPFCRSTEIASPLGAGPAKKLLGIVARNVVELINVVGTGAPFTTA